MSTVSFRNAISILIMVVTGCKTVPQDTVQFVDVTGSAGIEFKHTIGGSGEKYLVETIGSGAAFLDYNNDGYLDIYFVNSADLPGFTSERKPTNKLYRNNGDGTFTDVTAAAGVGDTGYGMGCTVADYDNDGDQDIYVTNFGRNLLYRNNGPDKNGNWTFTDITDQAGVGDERWSASCAFADFDNDGNLDLYVTNYLDFTLEGNKWCGKRGEGYRLYCHPREYDGVADILYRNNGDGTFTDISDEAGVANHDGKGLGVVFGDYDNDGDQDVFVGNDYSKNFLYRNDLYSSKDNPFASPLQDSKILPSASQNKNRNFTDVTLFAGVGFSEDGKIENGMGADFGDYNNDGYLDIIVTNFQHQTNTLYRNDGNGFFTDVSYASGTGVISLSYLGWGTNFCDYDNDGYQDLFVANGHLDQNIPLYDETATYAQRNLLFKNMTGESSAAAPQPVFVDVSLKSGKPFHVKKVSRGAAFGDFDNDGDMDILVTNSNQIPTLMRNDGGNRNNWLMIKTVGTKSNRDGIGARVKVVAGSLSQIREVKSGSSYLSQNDLRLLFGLGKKTQVDSVVVRWPSGIIQVMHNVQVNELLTIVEKSEY